MSNEIKAAVNTRVDISKEWQQPRLISILFCDSFEIAEDGKLNLAGIFDRIYVHPKVKQTPPFTLSIRTAETTDGTMLTICYAPNGEIPITVNSQAASKTEFTPNLPANLQSISGINPFHVSMEGVYWFDVSFRGQSLGGAALVVEFRETEDESGGTDIYI